LVPLTGLEPVSPKAPHFE